MSTNAGAISGAAPSVANWWQRKSRTWVTSGQLTVGRILFLLLVTVTAGMAYGILQVSRQIISALFAEKPPFMIDSGMDMPPKQKAASTGWSRLSDYELAVWHAEKVSNNDEHNMEMLLTDGSYELRNRGIKIQTCSECGHRRMGHIHDYLCILCRRAW